MRNEIKNLLSDLMPAVDFEADFLFASLDSLSIATILYVLNDKYGISLGMEDVTPRNFKSLDNIVRMVQSKRCMEARICQYAKTTPDTVAVVSGDVRLTYAELWDAILAHQTAGDLVILMSAGDADTWLRQKVDESRL